MSDFYTLSSVFLKLNWTTYVCFVFPEEEYIILFLGEVVCFYLAL